jgi:hypothetical protein
MPTTFTALEDSTLATRHLLIGHPEVPREIREALAEGRTIEAAFLLVNDFGLSMRDACELVR